MNSTVLKGLTIAPPYLFMLAGKLSVERHADSGPQALMMSLLA
jgi:hypothetical protein